MFSTLALGQQQALTLNSRSPCRQARSQTRRPQSLSCRAEGASVAQREAVQRSPVDQKAAELQKARKLAEVALEYYQYKKADDPVAEDTVATLRRKFEAVRRELLQASPEEYARLEGRDRSGAALPTTTVSNVDELIREVQQQKTVQQPATGVKHNILPSPGLTGRKPAVVKEDTRPEGTGEEIMLQGFNWDSWKHQEGWFNHLKSRAEEIGKMGFTTIWLPPFTESVSEQGYMPGDLYNLNSKYGSEEQLIGCVAALKSAGLKVLGDAVLNHRCAQHQDEQGRWNKYGGRLAWDQRAIVGDDHNFGGRGNKSSGDFFSAAPNIDHSQDFVKRDLQEWMRWLRSHVGFDGWRLDYVRGFHGSHVKDYMEASTPQFSVGEYWDALSYEWDGTPCHNQDAHRQRIVNWINAAGGLSTAFDITTKGIMHAVFERCEYWRLRDHDGKAAGLLGWWPSRAVTFLENHDTGSSQGHWRFPGHGIEQGYAYILTHPGTPCVFWDHLQDQRMRDVVSRLVDLRKRTGIHCRSKLDILRADRDVYAAKIDGKDGKSVIMKIGPGDFCPDLNEWEMSDCGHNWGVWERKQ